MEQQFSETVERIGMSQLLDTILLDDFDLGPASGKAKLGVNSQNAESPDFLASNDAFEQARRSTIIQQFEGADRGERIAEQFPKHGNKFELVGGGGKRFGSW